MSISAGRDWFGLFCTITFQNSILLSPLTLRALVNRVAAAGQLGLNLTAPFNISMSSLTPAEAREISVRGGIEPRLFSEFRGVPSSEDGTITKD
jgi:hypothetical protein